MSKPYGQKETLPNPHIHDQPSGKQTGSIDFEQRKDVHVCRGTQAGSMDNILSLETQSFEVTESKDIAKTEDVK